MGYQDKTFRAPLKGTCAKAQGASFREERKGDLRGRKGPKKKGQGGRLWGTSTRPRWPAWGGWKRKLVSSVYTCPQARGDSPRAETTSCASEHPTEKTRQGHLPCMCKILI